MPADPPARRGPPRWTLALRHAEGGAWETVDSAERAAVLRDAVLAPAFECREGDVVELRAPAGGRQGAWVWAGEGLVDAGRPDRRRLGAHGWDWFAAWEHPARDPFEMALLARSVDRGRLALAGCDGAAPLVRRARSVRAEAGALLAAVRAYVAGAPGAREAVLAAFEAARKAQATGASLRGYAVAAALAAARCLGDADDPPESCLVGVVNNVRAAVGPDWGGGVERGHADGLLADAIRRHVPVPVLLLARAGRPTPPSLGF